MKRVTVIAEIGINHQGNIKKAKRMIDKAKEAGADMAKFQSYRPLEVLGKDDPNLDETIIAQFHLSIHEELKKYCDAVEIEYCCSVFHPEDVNFFENIIGMKRYKIASRSVKDRALIEKIANTGKPVIISTGMATSTDLLIAKKILEGNVRLTFTYCLCKYPASIADLAKENLIWQLENLALLNNHDYGFSSHCPNIVPSLTAAMYGASILENHVVLDKNQKGCDVSSSLTFEEFGRMVYYVREMEKA